MNRLALAALVLCFVGCGARAPASKDDAARALNVANAAAGLDALAQRATDPVTAEIIAGARAFTIAAAGGIQVPAPSLVPAAIIADPAKYRKEGEAAQRAANGSSLWFWATVIGSIGVPVLVALAKNLGGPAGSLAGTVAEGLWAIYAPGESKQVEAARDTLVSHSRALVALLPPDKVPPTVHVALSALPGGQA